MVYVPNQLCQISNHVFVPSVYVHTVAVWTDNVTQRSQISREKLLALCLDKHQKLQGIYRYE